MGLVSTVYAAASPRFVDPSPFPAATQVKDTAVARLNEGGAEAAALIIAGSVVGLGITLFWSLRRQAGKAVRQVGS